MLRGDAESTQTIVATANLRIKLSGGSSDRAEVDLAAGTPVDAFSVGSEGGWKVSAPGVNAVHAYLFFDGTTLFVACAAGSIVQLGATTVGTDWKPVSAPATINLGSAALQVAVAGAAPAARAAPAAKPQPGVAPAARPQSAPVQRPQASAAPAARP
ncbi:MAG: hypothetical protein HYZ29_07535, partial [Myxococcales bacterium]|nr:hypothetical protein [Myxococcales bacterium]